MTFNWKLFYFSFLLIFIFNKSFAQSDYISSKEKKLAVGYSKILKSKESGDNYDSVEYYSEKFGNEFRSFIKNNPSTLNYPFKALIDSNYCFVKTSADGNFRIYSWDTETGGTMHFYNEIRQYRDKEKVFTVINEKNEEGDDSGFCSKIYSTAINNKMYYLPISNGVYSSKDLSQSISVMSINGGNLVDTVKLFKTKTRLLNKIDISFDFFSVVDRPERPLELITYDDRLKIVYIPLVNENGVVSEKNLIYQLKDNYFVFVGIEKGKRK
jgi:hypothetical protein